MHEPALPPPGPSVWDGLTLAVIGSGAVLYAIGTVRMRRAGARARPAERLAFWSGAAVLATAAAPPLDGLAALRFSAHMAQHELLMLLGAPLVVVGRPIVPWLWALGVRHHTSPLVSHGILRASRAWTALSIPVIAWLLHGLVIWLWHIPVFYEAAIRHEGLHAVQHASFVLTSALFWWGLVWGRYGRAAYGASVLFVFTTMIHTGVLGAFFTFSTTPFYGLYADRSAAIGIDAVGDQQLAGLYMWIPAGLVLTAFGIALLLAWMAASEPRTRRGSPG